VGAGFRVGKEGVGIVRKLVMLTTSSDLLHIQHGLLVDHNHSAYLIDK